MWRRYLGKREKIRTDRHGKCQKGNFDVWQGQGCKSNEVANQHPELFDTVRAAAKLTEYLFKR